MDRKLLFNCRNCQEYFFSRSNQAESFSCRKGYFDFTDFGDGRIEGQKPEKGSFRPDIPCGGKDLVPFAAHRKSPPEESDELII